MHYDQSSQRKVVFYHEGDRPMKQALCVTSVITVFVIGILALPRQLPADGNLLTVTMWWTMWRSSYGLLGTLHTRLDIE